MTDKDKYKSNEVWPSSLAPPVIEPPKCDIGKYRAYLKEFNLSPEEEDDLLRNWWKIMSAFVDLGFGVDSIHILNSSADKKSVLPNSPTDGPEEKQKHTGGTHDNE